MSTATKPKHISRIRELRGMKQEALAQAIGSNQQAISGIEGSEEVDPAKLALIAKALGVTVEALEILQKNLFSISLITFMIIVLITVLKEMEIVTLISIVLSILLIKLWSFTNV